MQYSRVMPPPPAKIACALQYSFQVEHCQFRLESCQYLNAQILLEWLYGIGNLVSMFQFKLSIIPRIFPGWNFDFFTSNPYQKLYYFSTGAIIWPPCRKDNFVRTKKLPILGKEDGLKWSFYKLKNVKLWIKHFLLLCHHLQPCVQGPCLLINWVYHTH